jgi:hypothetical protein
MPTTPQPPAGTSHSSDEEVEQSLSTLAQEGEVEFQIYLLAKAVPSDLESPDVSKIRE